MQENELASRRFLFILGSNRTGNSEALARHAPPPSQAMSTRTGSG